MDIFIGSEYNGSCGQLISMALISATGDEFYEVLPLPDSIDPWVEANVIPVLNKEPVSKEVFQSKLEEFLGAYETVRIVADWPEDIAHLMMMLITGPGTRLNAPHLTCMVSRELDVAGDIPHNALYDARAVKKEYCLANCVSSRVVNIA